MSGEMDEQALREKLEASVGSSNEILSDQGESMVRELLHKAQDAQSSTEAELLWVRSILATLEERHTDQAARIARLRVGIAPHKKVPPEVLGVIFAYSVEGSVLNVPPLAGSQCLILAQVCSRWRQIAVAEPALWSTVSIHDPHAACPEVLEGILSRAGFAIALYLGAQCIPWSILRALHRYSDQFQRVELRLYFSQSARYLAIPFKRLRVLRTLHLSIFCDLDSIGIINILTPAQLYPAIAAFTNASNLHSLDIQMDARFDLDLDLGTPLADPFPWLHLRHLGVFSNMSITGFLHILALCTQLVTCEAGVNRNEDHESFPGEVQLGTITLTKLQSLTLTPSYVSINGVLDSLVVPSLQALKISRAPDDAPSEALLRLLERSQCNIKTIYLALAPNFPVDFERLMRAVPDAVEFTVLNNIPIIESVLDLMRTRSLLPNVRVFEGQVSSCRAVRELTSDRCEPSPNGVTRGMKATVWVRKEELTDEWREFWASLPKQSAIEVNIGARRL